MVLLKLFIVFFRVGLFAIGGAYSFLPLLEKELVQNSRWLDKPEFLDVVGMAETFPGAISIKFATYTGYKVGGVLGVIVANIANLLPPALLMIVASVLYSKYRSIPSVKAALEMVRYAVLAMIVAIAIRLVDTSHLLQFKYLSVLVISLAIFTLTKVHPAFIIIGAAIYGGLIK
jgi:chromate transporter